MRALALLLTLSLSPPALAAEWKASLGAEAEIEALHWTAGALGPDHRTTRGIYTLKAPTTISRGRSMRLRVSPVMQWDPRNPSSRERFFWDFPEAYLQWQNLPWTVQAGMNTFTWGDTDVFNPLDVVNARRYYDPFRSEKLGAASLVVKRDFESFFVEAIYIPKQRKTLIPGENSRWLPRDIYRVRSIGSIYGPTRLLLPPDISYRYASDGEFSNALQNNLGFRAKFRLPGLDWTLAAFQGAAQTPDVRLRELTITPLSILDGVNTVSVDPDVAIQASYYPIRMTGTSFTMVIGDTLLKGAGAYTHVLNRRFDLPARIWEGVLGLEHTVSLGSGSLTALLQATEVDRGDALDTNSISLARMFDRSVMGALRWAPSEPWTVLLSYLADLKFKGHIWHGETTYKIMDGWRAKLSGDALGGAQETPIGSYRRNDRLTLSLLVQW